MSTNNDVTLSISVDTSCLDKLEAQLERIASLYKRINGHPRSDAGFVVATGKIFIKPAVISRAELTRERDSELSIVKREAQAAAASAGANFAIEKVLQQAEAEADKRLAAAKREEADKTRDHRLSKFERDVAKQSADIAYLSALVR